MDSPYKTLNFFYLSGVPFLPLTKRGKAVNCRIGLSNQLVFIPSIYFNRDLTIKPNMDLSWFLRKRDTKRKIEIYKQSIGESNGKQS